MFIAYDDLKNKIFINDARKGNIYYCPDCGCKLIVKKGKIRAPHFAHNETIENGLNECAFRSSSSMNECNIKWQNLFPEDNIEIIVEKEGKKDVAHVLINDVVLLFLHKDILVETFRDRINFFSSLGLSVIVVFDLIDLINENKIVQEASFGNENHFNWSHPKKLFKQIDLEKERCQIYLRLSDEKNSVLQRVTRCHNNFKKFFTDKKYSFSLNEFANKVITNTKELLYESENQVLLQAKVNPNTEKMSAEMYSTLTNLWKNDTTSMIAKNVNTGFVYSLSSSPQKSFDENSMVFGRRESESKYVNGQLIYEFFQNEVPLLDWNKKVWVLVTITNKSINGQNEKSNFSSEECLTITEIITFNSSAKEVKVKNIATDEKYILKLIPDSKNTLPKEYPLLLNDLGEILCLVETEKDNSYSKYFNQKVWIKIR